MNHCENILDTIIVYDLGKCVPHLFEWGIRRGISALKSMSSFRGLLFFKILFVKHCLKRTAYIPNIYANSKS